jgi:hypothetical protein
MAAQPPSDSAAQAAVSAAPPELVRHTYKLRVMLPFTIAVLLPFALWILDLLPHHMNGWLWAGSILAAGWIPYVLGLVGRARATAVDPDSRSRWRRATLFLAVGLGVWGALGTLVISASGKVQEDVRCSARSVADLQRLSAEIPWSVVGKSADPDSWMAFPGVAMADGSRTSGLCGPLLVRVSVGQGAALDGLPEVLRQAGFGDRIEVVRVWTAGAQAHVSGYDSDGRQLDVSVYEAGAGQADLDAYVDNP